MKVTTEQLTEATVVAVGECLDALSWSWFNRRIPLLEVTSGYEVVAAIEIQSSFDNKIK